MPFKQTPQKFNAAIRAIEVGSGDKKIVLGGENVLPFYTFDAAIENAPKVGVEISNLGIEHYAPGIKEAYGDAKTFAEIAKKAAEFEGVDFICINMEGADPNGDNMSVEDCVAIAKEIGDAVDLPIVIAGSKNHEKDEKLFDKVAAALEGKNIVVMSASEENYKVVSASAGLAYNQKVCGESAVDINLAKQLNVLITQMNIQPETIFMNVGCAAAGYGFEYVASTMDRITLAALQQNDGMLQMPIITPVSFETWNVKESVASEADFPEWGPAEERAIGMEVCTAAACLASGSNAVILRHPKSIATISKMIKDLM